MICSNTKCHEPAIAAVVQNVQEKTMTIYPLDRVKAGNIVYLCAKHASSTKPMLGWKVVNNYPELEELAKNLQSSELVKELKYNDNLIDNVDVDNKADAENDIIRTSFTKKGAVNKGESMNSTKNTKNGKAYNLPPKPSIPDDDMTVLMREITHNDINLVNGKKADIPAHLKGMSKGPFTAVRSGQTEMMTILGFPTKNGKDKK